MIARIVTVRHTQLNEIQRAMHFKRIIECGRLPGYAAQASAMSVDLYCKKVL